MVSRQRLIEVIEQVLEDYASIQYSHGEVSRKTAFDRTRGRFLLMIDGWENERRVHGCLIDIQIKNDKAWIERDGTEDGVALEFERLGVPKDQIVLAFYLPEVRQESDYAVS
jgi:XisI protein